MGFFVSETLCRKKQSLPVSPHMPQTKYVECGACPSLDRLMINYPPGVNVSHCLAGKPASFLF